MKVGYIRVSTLEQNEARQEVLLEQLGVDKVYLDKMSGKSKDRPQLQAMMQYVREGDVVIVESISRFARNTKDLLLNIPPQNERRNRTSCAPPPRCLSGLTAGLVHRLQMR